MTPIAWVRPTEVVVFPSPKGVGVIAVTSMYFPFGFSANASEGALGRIRSQIIEKAGYPERPDILCLWRTWDGRKLESQVHNHLRGLARAVPESLGKEWFLTSQQELLGIVGRCELPDLPPDRAVGGADETLEEGFSALMAEGATIEMGMVPGQAAISLRVRHPEDEAEPQDT
jgi:hypothetical protein